MKQGKKVSVMADSNRGGRPRKQFSEDSGPIPFLGLRLPIALKGQLEQAAAAANRSISAEAVARLELSFTLADQLDLQYGPPQAGVLVLLAYVMPITAYLALSARGYSPLSARLAQFPDVGDDRAAAEAWKQVRDAVNALLAIIGPQEQQHDVAEVEVDSDIRPLLHRVLEAIVSPEKCEDRHLAIIGQTAKGRFGARELTRIRRYLQKSGKARCGA